MFHCRLGDAFEDGYWNLTDPDDWYQLSFQDLPDSMGQDRQTDNRRRGESKVHDSPIMNR